MTATRMQGPNVAPPEYLVGLIRAVLGFLQASGLSKEQILEELQCSVRQLPDTRKAVRISKIDQTTASALGTAFHRWFRSARFLDEKGKPRALQLVGNSDSIQALLEREMPKKSARATAKELPNLGLVKKLRSGLYVPTSLHSLIRRDHPYLNEHTAHSIVRFLHTVRENVASTNFEKPLFERFAHVPSISEEHLQEFKDFTNQQGEALIDTVNDWLESRRLDPRKEANPKTIQAGLHVFAFVAKNGIIK